MDDVALRDEKIRTRKVMRAKRDALPPEQHAGHSQCACSNILSMLTFQAKECVGLFLPIQSEIDASLLLEPLIKRGCVIALPVPIGRTGMIFRSWHPGDALIDAGFGTKAPHPTADEVSPNTLIMPLLGFDLSCNRLGHGAGHYDRYISERILEGHKPRLVGLAFSLQQLDKVPIGVYDLPLDMIVTEKGLIAPAA